MCALAFGSLAAYAGQGDKGPFTLQMKFRMNEVSRYQTTMQIGIMMPGNGQTAPMMTNAANVTQEQKVIKTLPNGGGEIAVSMSGQSATNGMSTPINTGSKPIVLTYNTRGNIVSARGGSPNTPNGNLLFNNLFGSSALKAQGIFLPSKAVRPGESWTESISVPGLSGGNGSVKATFTRVEMVGRYRTAKIHQVVTMPLKIMLDRQLQPTTKPGQTAAVATGAWRLSSDSNFAIVEGKLIRLAGTGEANVVMKPRAIPGKPAKMAGGVPPGARLTVSIQLGNDLIE